MAPRLNSHLQPALKLNSKKLIIATTELITIDNMYSALTNDISDSTDNIRCARVEETDHSPQAVNTKNAYKNNVKRSQAQHRKDRTDEKISKLALSNPDWWEQVNRKCKEPTTDPCLIPQRNATTNSDESKVSNLKTNNPNAALAPFSKLTSNATHQMEREQRRRIISNSLLKDRDARFASMGTWKITKKISKDGKTYLRTETTKFLQK